MDGPFKRDGLFVDGLVGSANGLSFIYKWITICASTTAVRSYLAQELPGPSLEQTREAL